MACHAGAAHRPPQGPYTHFTPHTLHTTHTSHRASQLAAHHLAHVPSHPLPLSFGAQNGKDAYMIHFTYGDDFNEKGEFTPGKVGFWHWDKRDWTVRCRGAGRGGERGGCCRPCCGIGQGSLAGEGCRLHAWVGCEAGRAGCAAPLAPELGSRWNACCGGA